MLAGDSYRPILINSLLETTYVLSDYDSDDEIEVGQLHGLPPKANANVPNVKHVKVQLQRARKYNVEHHYNPIYDAKDQNCISQGDRSISAQWMFSVVSDMGLTMETLFASIKIFDQLISNAKLSRAMLPITCLTCILLAHKMEEPGRLSLITSLLTFQPGITAQQVREHELWVCERLKFDFATTSSYQYLDLLPLGKADRVCAEYFLVCALLSESCQFYLDEELAHASIVLAGGVFNNLSGDCATAVRAAALNVIHNIEHPLNLTCPQINEKLSLALET